MARELSIREAWRNSEIEAMAEAFDEDPEDNLSAYPNYVTADDGNYDHLDQVEGWDGEPLSNAEQWETAINGPMDGGCDHPLQHGRGYGPVGCPRRARGRDRQACGRSMPSLHPAPTRWRASGLQQAREQALYNIIANPEQAAGTIVALGRATTNWPAAASTPRCTPHMRGTATSSPAPTRGDLHKPEPPGGQDARAEHLPF